MNRRGENGWRIVTGMPLRTIGALREISCGRVDGLRVDEVRARFPALWRRNVAQTDPRFASPGGENYRASRARVWRAIVRIAAAHPGQRAVAVTHAVAGSRCRGPWPRRSH